MGKGGERNVGRRGGRIAPRAPIGRSADKDGRNGRQRQLFVDIINHRSGVETSLAALAEMAKLEQKETDSQGEGERGTGERKEKDGEIE